MVVAAARMAESDSGLDIAADSERIGASVATGIGGLQSFQDCHTQLRDRGPDRVNPFSIPAIIPNLGAGWLSIELGTRGPLSAPCTACAASNMAIGEGMDAIRLGRADVMFCGGTEAPVTQVGIAGFGAMRALSRRNDDPERASRPFDAGRDGFVMGEAGAVLVLEELEHAKARGAKIYAEVAGYGMSGDAFHITAPSEGHDGAVRSMRAAFRNGGVTPDQVQYVNAHGTSTPLGDDLELEAVENVFGDAAKGLAMSSTKSATGHLLGAAGAVEAIFSILAVRDNVAPPTLNLDHPSRDSVIDRVAKTAQERRIDYALSNSFGFGGTNASVIFRATN
jgi:3-oxoacyl-[acyl-carrier-protein] synthase II